jgi:Leucine-rich repeat (LRR) protein
VLVLEDEDDVHLGNQQIKYLGSLIQLKYLKINSTSITKLPNRIGHLQNLQTLDLSGSSIEKFPPTIGRLQNLVHLLVGGYYVYFPDEIGDLQALRTLSFVCPCNPVNFVGQLRRLTNLRILGARR